MRLYYQGTDITDSVNILGAIHRDVSDGRMDCLELELDYASAWYRWGPETDDTIELIQGEYTTGPLYLNTILPEGDKFRMLATGAKRRGRRKAWGSFKDKSLAEVMSLCAAEDGLNWGLWGLNGSARYSYLLRNKEQNGAFLGRLIRMEGGVLKTVSGKYQGIGIEEAQFRGAAATFNVQSSDRTVRYVRREDVKHASLTIRTPHCTVTAYDREATGGDAVMLGNIPATDSATAGRWARGLLLHENRQAEELTIETTFAPALTAMVRADVTGDTTANGAWIVDQVEHDFKRGKSRATLKRCIYTIV